MVRGFEHITHELSKDEIRIAKIITAGFQGHRGKGNTISGATIRKWLKAKYSITLTGPRLRKIIHALRVSGMVKKLVGNSRGYFIAETRKELEDYIVSLAQRAASITEVKDTLIDDMRSQYTQVKLNLNIK